MTVLTQAIIKVAEVNHYLVGLVGTFTIDEYAETEQELIDLELKEGPEYDVEVYSLRFAVFHNKRKIDLGFLRQTNSLLG